jgi:hypothetical protein
LDAKKGSKITTREDGHRLSKKGQNHVEEDNVVASTKQQSESLRKRSIENLNDGDVEKILQKFVPTKPSMRVQNIEVIEKSMNDQAVQSSLPFKISRPSNTGIASSRQQAPLDTNHARLVPCEQITKVPQYKHEVVPSTPDIPVQSDDSTTLDSQTAAYLRKPEHMASLPSSESWFDYNETEFQLLDVYMSELTKTLADALCGNPKAARPVKEDVTHALGMVRELVEVCYLQSFDATEYLRKGRLGKHIMNLYAIIMGHLKPRDFYLEAALLKISEGLKQLENAALKSSRSESGQHTPRVLNIPPSYFLILASKAGWVKSQFRFRMIKNIRSKLANSYELSPKLALVLAVDIDKEASRVFPSFDACSKYVALVRELFSELKVS